MPKTVKEQINEGLLDMFQGIKAPELKKNEGALYVNAFFWQEVSSIADKKLKAAWVSAQARDGVLPDDEEMRALGEGEHIVSEAGSFSCVAKVTKPQRRFDKDTFIALAAKKFKVGPDKILELYDAACLDGKPPLQKRILEA